MDKKSITGLVLITAIMVGWMIWSAPSKEEVAKQKRIQDSVAQVQLAELKKQEALALQKVKTDSVKTVVASINSPKTDTLTTINNDSLKAIQLQKEFGVLAGAIKGENKEIIVENENIKATIAALGGKVKRVELKKYKTFDAKPLVLFDGDSTEQNIEFISNSRIFSTANFYFVTDNKSVNVKGNDSAGIALRLYSDDKAKYIEYVYSLRGNTNILNYKINVVGFNDIIAANTSDISLRWSMITPWLEKDKEVQTNASTIYFKYVDDEVDKLSPGSDEQKSLEAKVQWIGFKQQFFTSVLIADKGFEKPTDIATLKQSPESKYIKKMSANITIPYGHNPSESFAMKFYFGPNHYNTLKTYDIDLEKQIELGWSIFSLVNKWIVIPTFDFLGGFNMNYGIIILLLTIFIKILLFPIAYKTYLSSAKMRILKPEIDELGKKYDDPMKKQQATMALYKQAGVNPLAGCIPVLLQLPILAALFSFFPASFELRQESFLWALDLSTYDSIYDFGFNIPFYGNHVSLFTLLMTISTLLYTYSNSQLMGTNEQMPGMKFMMYAMPIIFLGVFNNYSAGLSYYYFLANMITFGQTFIMRKFIDEKALHAKIQENKKKPVKQSNFQKRLEELAKQRQQTVKKK